MHLRFNFVVEVDCSKISEISKLQLPSGISGRGTQTGRILGLPHTAEGYHEAKKILETTYGEDIKVHKALIMDLESLPNITSANRVKEIHDFHSQLSRTVRTLVAMKKLQGAQSYVYSIMDTLGAVREGMAQKMTTGKSGDWKNWWGNYASTQKATPYLMQPPKPKQLRNLWEIKEVT